MVCEKEFCFCAPATFFRPYHLFVSLPLARWTPIKRDCTNNPEREVSEMAQKENSKSYTLINNENVKWYFFHLWQWPSWLHSVWWSICTCTCTRLLAYIINCWYILEVNKSCNWCNSVGGGPQAGPIYLPHLLIYPPHILTPRGYFFAYSDHFWQSWKLLSFKL